MDYSNWIPLLTLAVLGAMEALGGLYIEDRRTVNSPNKSTWEGGWRPHREPAGGQSPDSNAS